MTDEKISEICTCGEGGKNAVYHDVNCPRGQGEIRENAKKIEQLSQGECAKILDEISKSSELCIPALPRWIEEMKKKEAEAGFGELEKIQDLIDGAVGPDYFNWEKLPGRVAAVINEYVVKNCQEKHDAFSKDNYSHVEPAEPSFRQEVEELSKDLSLNAVRSELKKADDENARLRIRNMFLGECEDHVNEIYNLLNDDPTEEFSLDIFVGSLRALRSEKDDLESENAKLKDVNDFSNNVANNIGRFLDDNSFGNGMPIAERIQLLWREYRVMKEKFRQARLEINLANTVIINRINPKFEIDFESCIDLEDKVNEIAKALNGQDDLLYKIKHELMLIGPYDEEVTVLDMASLSKDKIIRYKGRLRDKDAEIKELSNITVERRPEIKYLAAPYSHENSDIMESRFNLINMAAASLLKQGHNIYSPISHCHRMAKDNDMPKGFEFWRKYYTAMISVCSELLVLRLPGWKESEGVQAEIKIAEGLGIPVRYVDLGVV